MSTLTPLETLFDVDRGKAIPLPSEVARIYGRLVFPTQMRQPYVIGNFVSSLDGVTSLQIPGQSGGGPISGFNPHDRAVMGLLRAVADAVIVGAGTLRDVPHHVWTPAFICPALADSYEKLRVALDKVNRPLNVVVTFHGDIDPKSRVFQSGEAPVLIVTTASGARRLDGLGLPRSVQVTVKEGDDGHKLSARSILSAVASVGRSELILVEGGPHLLGDFFAEKCLDEQFLTLAPQVVGRDDSSERSGLVAGMRFSPERPLWGTLIGVKRGESHLFLRYAFPSS